MPNAEVVDASKPVAEKSPIERWIERKIKNGDMDHEDMIAALRFTDELHCADAIAETVAPKLFSLDAKLALREAISASKNTLETSDLFDLDAHARIVDAASDSPIGQWLHAMALQRSRVTEPRLLHLMALETAAARDVLADLRCAQAAGRTVFATDKVTPQQALKLLEGLCEMKERLASLSEETPADGAVKA